MPANGRWDLTRCLKGLNRAAHTAWRAGHPRTVLTSYQRLKTPDTAQRPARYQLSNALYAKRGESFVSRR
jgi:hypothetical protein